MSEREPGSGEETTLHVRRARRGTVGSGESVSWLVARFTPVLIEQARYQLGSAGRGSIDPEDLAMDVWQRVLPRMPDLEERSGRLTPVFVKFLSIVLKNRTQDVLAKHRRGRTVDLGGEEGEPDPLQQLPSADRGVVSLAMADEEFLQVRGYLDRLDEQDREIIVLRGIEQLDYAEIAQQLAIAEATLRKRYSRAIKKVRDDMPQSVFVEFDDA